MWRPRRAPRWPGTTCRTTGHLTEHPTGHLWKHLWKATTDQPGTHRASRATSDGASRSDPGGVRRPRSSRRWDRPHQPPFRKGRTGPVKPSPFVHHAPRTVDEAVPVLAEVGPDAKVPAGGQSFTPMLTMRLAAPAPLVDINRVSGLGTVEVTPDAVRIGALVRHAELERHGGARAALPLLRQALVNVAHPAIRNRGTTVGSIAHADPSGEMPAVLALLDGEVQGASATGTRRIPAADFFLGPLESSLAEDEMAVGASFQRLPAGSGTAFLESARRHGDYALAGVAAAVTAVGGVVHRVRLSFVSVTPTPDVLDLTEAFAGRDLRDIDWSEAAEPAREHVDPDADVHATVAYRRMLVGVLTTRALAQAAAAATGDPPETDAAPWAGAAGKALA